jgi:hypothetical protein
VEPTSNASDLGHQESRQRERLLNARDRAKPHRRTLSVALVLVGICLGLLLPGVARADTITAAFPSFDSTNVQALKLNGNAALNGAWLRLTPASASRCGAAWWLNRVYLGSDRSFSAFFTFRFSSPGGMNGGADGLTFTVQPSSNSVLTQGGGLGYAGITPSFAVEFDTFQNADCGDIDNNHVGFDVNGSMESTDSVTAPWNLKNGSTYHCWIDYDGDTDLAEVRLSTTSTRPASALLSGEVNLDEIVAQQSYVGFTAATGGGWEAHDLGSFYFNNTYTPIDTTSHTYTTAATALGVGVADAVLQTGHTSAVTATATDPLGTPVADQQVTFSASSGSVSPTTATTDAQGHATATFTGGVDDADATVTGVAQGGAYGTAALMVDGSAPTTTDDAPSAWQHNAVTVHLSASDALSGVATTQYRIDGAPWKTGDQAAIGAPSDASNDGAHTVEYRSTDVAGNGETIRGCTVRIDTSAPHAEAAIAPVADPVGVSHEPVTVTLTALDGASGVAATYYRVGTSGSYHAYDPAAKPVISERGVATLCYYSVDNAGNAGPERQMSVEIAPPAAPRPLPLRGFETILTSTATHAKLRFIVHDPGSRVSHVVLTVTRRGVAGRGTLLSAADSSVVARVDLGAVPTETAITQRLAALKAGLYAYRITATAPAGVTATYSRGIIAVGKRPFIWIQGGRNVVRGQRSTVRYLVLDPYAGRSQLEMLITLPAKAGHRADGNEHANRVIRRIDLGHRRTNVIGTAAFHLDLAPGLYRYVLRAHDDVGTTGLSGSNLIQVK